MPHIYSFQGEGGSDHDPRLANRCDRIVELVDGRIVSDRPNLHPVRHSADAEEIA